ncbi:MAG: hypothetical protein HC772_20420 [Leptolyngbyaceae cyanobacterium CRU_2_3]|nr:hypothetical protein [Leptolyngbyaceae cyanobacterium CRU_2_3]
MGVTIVLIYRLFQSVLRRNQPFWHLADALLPAFFLMLIPTLSQTNWNHGQEIFSRYAFWTTMVLIVWLVANLETFAGLTRFSVVAIAIGLQLLPNQIFFRHAREGHYLKMKPQATWLLTHLPGWYQPDPEIFAERTRGYERFGETIAPNPIEAPFIFVDKAGKIRKLLIHRSQAAQTDPRLCGSNGKLTHMVGAMSVSSLLAKVTFNAQGWGYLNGSFQCALPLSLRFSQDGNARNYAVQGWSKPDAEGSLMKTRGSSLLLPITSQNLKDARLRIQLRVDAASAKELPKMEVIANDRSVSQWQLATPGQISEYEAMIPKKLLSSRSPLTIEFRWITPSQSEQSAELPVQVKIMQLEITEVSPLKQKKSEIADELF